MGWDRREREGRGVELAHLHPHPHLGVGRRWVGMGGVALSSLSCVDGTLCLTLTWF
jgi:hypothetical protein